MELQLTYEASGSCLIGPERALPLEFIVVEFVTNAVKYAHPSDNRNALGGLRHGNGSITVDVADDGVGLPDGFNPMVSGGLGFRLMRSLADQIGGKLNFTDSGTGLTASVQMPV